MQAPDQELEEQQGEHFTPTAAPELLTPNSAQRGPESAIGVVLVNFETPPDVLRRTVAALLGSAGVGSNDMVRLIDLVVIDNASQKNRLEAKTAVAELGDARIRWIDLARNTGFSGGVNRAIATLDQRCSLVFLCNPDATVEAEALRRCADALIAEPKSCVSAAPKMLLELASGEAILDSIGHVVNERGEAFNLGLGQPDLGQYDRPSNCFGPCFGAALIRRDAFDPSQVGPLDESLFLYYEDVDWNWRAQLLGFDSVTVPAARVHHVMSISMRDRPYGDKFELTERNLLICTLKNFSGTHGVRVAVRRCLGLLKGSITMRHYPGPGLRALSGLARRLPTLLRDRQSVQCRRVRSDAQVLKFALGEQTFFDAVTYEPIDRAAAERFARAKINRPG